MVDFELLEQSSVWVDEVYPANQSSITHTSVEEGISFEGESFEELTADGLDVSMMGSRNPLRTSRRKIQKGSAIVLNADRMRKIVVVDSEKEDQQSLGTNSSPEQQLLQTLKSKPKIQRSPPAKAEVRPFAVSPKANSAIKPTLFQNNQQRSSLHISEQKAVSLIEIWYKQQSGQRHQRFTQFGQWSYSTAERVHAVYLGYQVRKLFRKNNEIKRLLAAQKDVKRVLDDLIMQSLSPNSRQSSTPTKFKKASDLPSLKSIMTNNYNLLDASDQVLVNSLIKELLLEREKLIKCLFQSRKFVSFPKPGHWQLNVRVPVVSAADKAKKRMSVGNSPAREPNLARQRQMQETPPHIKSAVERPQMKVPVKLFVGNTHRLIDESLTVITELTQSAEDTTNTSRPLPKPLRSLLDEDSFSHSTPPPPHKATIIDERPAYVSSGGFGSGSGFGSSNGLPSHGSNRSLTTKSSFNASINKSNNNIKNQMNLSSIANLSSNNGSSVESKRKSISTNKTPAKHIVERHRAHDGGHIQLEILSGDKLIAAKKGAATIPDRKPGLKITLMLPSTPTSTVPTKASPVNGQSANLKRIYHTAKDCEELTLNPVWNSSFILSLPFPKMMIKSMIENNQLPYLPLASVSDMQAVSLSDAEYESLCRVIMQHWSSGQVLIEVCDGERFNEEIFMGQTVLLISSFLPMIKKLHELEIKGTFQLEKMIPTNRVSGSVSLHAFLHAPKKAYLEEQLTAIIDQIKRQPSVSPASVPVTKSQSRSSSRLSVGGHNRHLHAQNDRGVDIDDEHDHHNHSGLSDSDNEHHHHHSNGSSNPLLSYRGTSSNKLGSVSADGSNSNDSRLPNHPTNKHPPLFTSKFMKDLVASLDEETNSAVSKPVNNAYSTPEHGGATSFAKKQNQQAWSDPKLEESDNIRIPAGYRRANSFHGGLDPSSAGKSVINSAGHNNSGNRRQGTRVSLTRPEAYQIVRQQQHSTADGSGADGGSANKVTMSSIVSKESAQESRNHTRNFLSAMNKQMNNLEAIQHTAEAAMDRLMQHPGVKKTPQSLQKASPHSQSDASSAAAELAHSPTSHKAQMLEDYDAPMMEDSFFNDDRDHENIDLTRDFDDDDHIMHDYKRETDDMLEDYADDDNEDDDDDDEEDEEVAELLIDLSQRKPQIYARPVSMQSVQRAVPPVAKNVRPMSVGAANRSQAIAASMAKANDVMRAVADMRLDHPFEHPNNHINDHNGANHNRLSSRPPVNVPVSKDILKEDDDLRMQKRGPVAVPASSAASDVEQSPREGSLPRKRSLRRLVDPSPGGRPHAPEAHQPAPKVTQRMQERLMHKVLSSSLGSNASGHGEFSLDDFDMDG